MLVLLISIVILFGKLFREFFSVELKREKLNERNKKRVKPKIIEKVEKQEEKEKPDIVENKEENQEDPEDKVSIIILDIHYDLHLNFTLHVHFQISDLPVPDQNRNVTEDKSKMFVTESYKEKSKKFLERYFALMPHKYLASILTSLVGVFFLNK